MSARSATAPAPLALAGTMLLVGSLALAGTPPRAGAARTTGHVTSLTAATSASLTAAVASPSRLQVTQVEYRLLLSRGVVHAGPLRLETIDRGSDPHDLRMRAISSGREYVAPELTPGRRWDGVVTLKPGVYHLWCSLPEHAKLGMRATLGVVR
jgi:hypothetical protein